MYWHLVKTSDNSGLRRFSVRAKVRNSSPPWYLVPNSVTQLIIIKISWIVPDIEVQMKMPGTHWGEEGSDNRARSRRWSWCGGVSCCVDPRKGGERHSPGHSLPELGCIGVFAFFCWDNLPQILHLRPLCRCLTKPEECLLSWSPCRWTLPWKKGTDKELSLSLQPFLDRER